MYRTVHMFYGKQYELMWDTLRDAEQFTDAIDSGSPTHSADALLVDDPIKVE